MDEQDGIVLVQDQGVDQMINKLDGTLKSCLKVNTGPY